MKRNFSKIFIIIMINLMVFYIEIFISKNIYAKEYKIYFDTKPKLVNKKVYVKGYEIGVVKKDYLTFEGNVIVEIEIYDEYDKLMQHDVAFYVDNGKLILYDFGPINRNIEDFGNKKIFLGFHNKISFYLYYLKKSFKKRFYKNKKNEKEIFYKKNLVLI